MLLLKQIKKLKNGPKFGVDLWSTETIKTIRDGEPRTATSTFTQLLSCETVWLIRDGVVRKHSDDDELLLNVLKCQLTY